MREVIMMCGVCGSGKTTYAKQKEREGYVRLSIDEEMWAAYGQCGVDYPKEAYEKLSKKAEERLRDRMAGLLQDGKNLVIDFSFWSRKNRDWYREFIAAHGGHVRLVYMKADREVLRRRLAERNRSIHANSPFVVTEEILNHHYEGFEEPAKEEAAEILVQG